MPLPQCLLLLLTVAALLLAPFGSWAQPQTTQPGFDRTAAPLFQELATLKGIAAPGPPPPILVKTRPEIRRYIEQELDRRYSPARVESERKGMAAWGLIPRDYDLRRLFVDLVNEQIAAYYDPLRKVMVLGDWLAPEEQQVVLLHELVHALQDRQVSLDAFVTPTPGRGDQVLARQALMEGEAVALSFDVLLRTQGTELSALPDLETIRATIGAGLVGQAANAAPKFLRDLLLFPYLEGLNFAYEFRKQQPWSAISTLYGDPPRSTAQILHPEKRLKLREDPIPIALPDITPLMPAGRPAADDELGEFGLGAVVGLHLGEPAGRRIAAGWRGDRYRVWEDEAGRFILVYHLVMDGPRTANAFALAYTTIMEKRHPAVARSGMPGRDGATVSWLQGPRGFLVERRGAEVLVLEQVPAATTDRIREAVWRGRGVVLPKP